MKAEIHPNYHTITVVMTDGTEYLTRSTWGKEGDKLNLDIDSKSHPAWTGGTQQMLDRAGPEMQNAPVQGRFLLGVQPNPVIASAAKQSISPRKGKNGLLRRGACH